MLTSRAKFEYLKGFMPFSQLRAIEHGLRGEEKQFFSDKIDEMVNRITTMPTIYGQDGKGDEAIVYLHYFRGNGDWYITEKDSVAGEPQYQAFGLADIGFGGEMGYISIQELIENDIELDLHFTPKPLKDIGR